MAMIAKGMNCLSDQFSYLAMLEAIATGGVEAFWSKSENFRCLTGNQSLASAQAGAIGADHIRLRPPVGSIELRGPIAQLSL